MNENRQRENDEGWLSHCLCNPLCRLAKGKFLGPKDRNGLTRETVFIQSRANDIHKILNSNQTDCFLFKSNRGKDGQLAKKVAQVVEQVITRSVDKTCFENREIQFGGADNLFSLPFCRVIFRFYIWTHIQITNEHELFHASTFRGGNRRAGPFHVQSIKCLFRIFQTCPRTVDDCLTTFKGQDEFIGIVCVNGQERSALHWLHVPRIVPARDHDHFVTT